MKKFLRVTIFLILLTITFLPQSLVKAETKTKTKTETKKETVDFSLYAKAAVLMDAKTGRILYEKDGYTHMPNASTTKILTAILAIESGALMETATVSSYAASMPKVRLGMKKGDKFVLEDLLYSLMLESHNDSAVVIAEYIGQTVEGFADMMNRKAREIGCTNTYFITPNGLDKEDETGIHGTTARDLSLLMSYCIKNETFLKVTQTRNYSFSNVAGTRNYSCVNHNAFLSMMDGALSGKTGFTGNAGYCYVGALRQGERTFIVSLLACGWPSNKTYKWADTRNLMNYGLSNYQYEDVFEHGKILPDITVQEAAPKSGKLHEPTIIKPVIDDAVLSVLKKDSEEIKTIYRLPDVLTAPFAKGTEIGTVSYYLGETELVSYPIKITETVKKIDLSWFSKYVMERFFMSEK
jgi:D-alanyl-D-alanine carboxypeptidase (penicillin-binding protein 5/6)